uniref:Uncharacterized protein n=1 Tax=Tetranychus urticae TaxID=32264 RepID=T1KPH5_TETUR
MDYATEVPSTSYAESMSSHDQKSQMYASCRKGTEVDVGLRASLMQRARWIKRFPICNKKGCIRSVDRDTIVKLIDDFMSALKKIR